MSIFCNFHLYETDIDDCVLCKIIVFAVDPNIYLSTAITTMKYKSNSGCMNITKYHSHYFIETYYVELKINRFSNVKLNMLNNLISLAMYKLLAIFHLQLINYV